MSALINAASHLRLLHQDLTRRPCQAGTRSRWAWVCIVSLAQHTRAGDLSLVADQQNRTVAHRHFASERTKHLNRISHKHLSPLGQLPKTCGGANGRRAGWLQMSARINAASHLRLLHQDLTRRPCQAGKRSRWAWVCIVSLAQHARAGDLSLVADQQNRTVAHRHFASERTKHLNRISHKHLSPLGQLPKTCGGANGRRAGWLQMSARINAASHLRLLHQDLTRRPRQAGKKSRWAWVCIISLAQHARAGDLSLVADQQNRTVAHRHFASERTKHLNRISYKHLSPLGQLPKTCGGANWEACRMAADVSSNQRS